MLPLLLKLQSVTTVPSHPQDPLPFSQGWPVQLVRGLMPGISDPARSNPVCSPLHLGCCCCYVRRCCLQACMHERP